MSQEITESQVLEAREAINRRQTLTNEQWIVADKAMCVAAATIREWETPRKALRDEFAMSAAIGMACDLNPGSFHAGQVPGGSTETYLRSYAALAYAVADAMLEARKS